MTCNGDCNQGRDCDCTIQSMTAVEVTAEIYKKNIPKCCSLKTIQQHEDILLCWGLLASIKKGYTMDCGDCEMRLKDD